jgi:hypothetical protein
MLLLQTRELENPPQLSPTKSTKERRSTGIPILPIDCLFLSLHRFLSTRSPASAIPFA